MIFFGNKFSIKKPFLELFNLTFKQHIIDNLCGEMVEFVYYSLQYKKRAMDDMGSTFLSTVDAANYVPSDNITIHFYAKITSYQMVDTWPLSFIKKFMYKMQSKIIL